MLLLVLTVVRRPAYLIAYLLARKFDACIVYCRDLALTSIRPGSIKSPFSHSPITKPRTIYLFLSGYHPRRPRFVHTLSAAPRNSQYCGSCRNHPTQPLYLRLVLTTLSTSSHAKAKLPAERRNRQTRTTPSHIPFLRPALRASESLQLHIRGAV